MPKKTKKNEPVITGESLISDYDIHLFKEGNHSRCFEKLGSHITTLKGQQGTFFAVWAPNAKSVSVMGDFNGWDTRSHQLAARWDGSGIWEGFIPDIGVGELYKFRIYSNHDDRISNHSVSFDRV